MLVACFQCGQTWDVPEEQLRDARPQSGLGMKEHSYTCPHCQAENALTEEQIASAHDTNAQIPVTGMPMADEPQSEHPPRARNDVTQAPVNPVPGPGEGAWARHGVVRAHHLDVRRDHTERMETLSSLRKGERVAILDIWTDGHDTWAQLGPERWVMLTQNGEMLIELLDD